VVPVLRREFDALRPADVPDGPTHAARLAAAGSPAGPVERTATDRWTGTRAEDANVPALS
jgi:hypothetical protein